MRKHVTFVMVIGYSGLELGDVEGAAIPPRMELRFVYVRSFLWFTDGTVCKYIQ